MDYTQIDYATIDIPAQRMSSTKFFESLKEILEEHSYTVQAD